MATSMFAAACERGYGGRQSIGSNPDAEARVFAAFKEGTRIQLPHIPLIFNTHILELKTRRRQLDQLISLIRATVTALPLLRPIRVSLAHALWEVGEMAQAQAALDELVTPGPDWPIDATWAATVHLTAEACVALGDRRVAGRFYPQLTPFLDQVGLGAACGATERWRIPRGKLQRVSQIMTPLNRISPRRWKSMIGSVRGLRAIHTRRAHAAMLIARGRAKDRRRALDLITAGEASANALDIAAATARFAQLREAIVT